MWQWCVLPGTVRSDTSPVRVTARFTSAPSESTCSVVVRCSPQRHHADHERAAALHHAPAPGERAVPGVEHVAQRAAERDDRVKRLLVEAAEVADVELPPVLDARREPAGLADLAVARELRGGQIADDDAAAEPVQDLLGRPLGAHVLRAGPVDWHRDG